MIIFIYINYITHLNLFNKVYMSILFLLVGSKIYSLFYLYFLAAFIGFPAKAS